MVGFSRQQGGLLVARPTPAGVRAFELQPKKINQTIKKKETASDIVCVHSICTMHIQNVG